MAYLDIKAQPKLAESSAMTLAAIELGYQQELGLKVKREYWKEWMQEWNEATEERMSEENDVEMKRWFDDGGLDVGGVGAFLVFERIEYSK